jgi:hypothetical protein
VVVWWGELGRVLKAIAELKLHLRLELSVSSTTLMVEVDADNARLRVLSEASECGVYDGCDI